MLHRPVRAVIVKDPAPSGAVTIADREDVVRAGAPYGVEFRRTDVVEERPTHPVVVHDRAPITHGEDVVRAAAPHAVEGLGRVAVNAIS